MRHLNSLFVLSINSLHGLLACGVALVIAGCGSEVGTGTGTGMGTGTGTSPPPAKATPFAAEGTFTNCASGTAGPNGNVFLNGGGFAPGELTLKRDGTKVTAAFVDSASTSTSIDFESQGPAAATLTPGQRLDSFAGICVTGPGNPEPPYPATLSADTGSLVYSSRTAILSLNGTLAGKLGACGEQSTPKTFWVVCGDGPNVAAADVGESSTADALAVGTYSCESFIDTYTRSGARKEYAASGGTGTLTLSKSSTGVTAAYRKDSLLDATLELEAIGKGSAVARPGQSLSTACNPAVPQIDTLPITAASLEVSPEAVSLTFAGTMAAASACPDTQIVGNVTCYTR
jgi:hypothetical protein